MPQEFINDLTKILNDYQERVERAPKNIAKQLFMRVINRTPIDFVRKDPKTVGSARANWIASVQRFNKTIESDLDEVGGKAPLLNTRGPTVIAMEDIVNNADINSNPRIYLANNVPYIRLLEYVGYSMQAPFGMRQVTLAEFPDLAEQVARSERSRRVT